MDNVDNHHDTAYHNGGSLGLLLSIVSQRVQTFQCQSLLHSFLHPHELFNAALYLLDRTSVQVMAIGTTFVIASTLALNWAIATTMTLLHREFVPIRVRASLLAALALLPDFRQFNVNMYVANYLFEQADKNVDGEVDINEFYTNLLILMYGYGHTLAGNIVPTSLRFGDLVLKPPPYNRMQTLFDCFDYDNAQGLNREQFQLLMFVVVKWVSVRIVTQALFTWGALKFSNRVCGTGRLGGRVLLLLRHRTPRWLFPWVQTSTEVAVATATAMFLCHNVFEIIDVFYVEQVQRNAGYYFQWYQDLIKWNLKKYVHRERKGGGGGQSGQSRVVQRIAKVSSRRCSAPMIVHLKSSPST